MIQIRSTGLHLIGTMIRCNEKILTDYDLVLDFLDKFPPKIGMVKIDFPDNPFLKSCVNDEDPLNVGNSGMVLLTTSHFSIHTWPLYDNSLDFDVFSCNSFNIQTVLRLLEEFFEGEHMRNVIVERGHYGARTR